MSKPLIEGFGAVYAHYFGQQQGHGGPVFERNGIVERYVRMVTGGIPTFDAVNGLLNPQPLNENLDEAKHHHFAAIYAHHYARPNDEPEGKVNVYPDNPMRKYVEMLRTGEPVEDVISEMFKG